MSYSLNTSHALYPNLVELIGVQSGALVSCKTARTFTVDAAATFSSGSIGEFFKMGAASWTPEGASFTPSIIFDETTSPNHSIVIVTNSLPGSGSGPITNANPIAPASLSLNANYSGDNKGNVALGYAARGVSSLSTIMGSGVKSFCMTRSAATTANNAVSVDVTDELIINGVSQGTETVSRYNNTDTFDVIGGADGQSNHGLLEFVWIAVFNKALSASEALELHNSLGASNAFSLVTTANNPPTFSGPNIGNQTGTVGAALSFSVASKFSDTDALTFSAVGTWPAGVTVSSAGLISGTPTTAGTYATLKVRVTDTASQTVDSDTFSFIVTAAGDVTAPTMNGTVSATNLTTTSYTLNWSAGSDNVGVTGYQYRINAGAWVDVGNLLAANVTGRTAGSTDTIDVRDYDAAGNFSTVISANITLNAVSAGTFTSEVLKDNVGNVVANKALNFVALYNDTTHALVVLKTGLSTNASGVFTVSDPLLTAGQTYRPDWETVDGQRRMPRKVAT